MLEKICNRLQKLYKPHPEDWISKIEELEFEVSDKNPNIIYKADRVLRHLEFLVDDFVWNITEKAYKKNNNLGDILSIGGSFIEKMYIASKYIIKSFPIASNAITSSESERYVYKAFLSFFSGAGYLVLTNTFNPYLMFGFASVNFFSGAYNTSKVLGFDKFCFYHKKRKDKLIKKFKKYTYSENIEELIKYSDLKDRISINEKFIYEEIRSILDKNTNKYFIESLNKTGVSKKILRIVSKRKYKNVKTYLF
jgi:hypothetical protein